MTMTRKTPHVGRVRVRRARSRRACCSARRSSFGLPLRLGDVLRTRSPRERHQIRDAGATVRVSDMINLGVTGYNLYGAESTQFPRAIGAGVARAARSPQSRSRFDVRFALAHPGRAGGGALRRRPRVVRRPGSDAQQGYPIRIGVLHDNNLLTKGTYVSGGLGLASMKLGIDPGARRQGCPGRAREPPRDGEHAVLRASAMPALPSLDLLPNSPAFFAGPPSPAHISVNVSGPMRLPASVRSSEPVALFVDRPGWHRLHPDAASYYGRQQYTVQPSASTCTRSRIRRRRDRIRSSSSIRHAFFAAVHPRQQVLVGHAAPAEAGESVRLRAGAANYQQPKLPPKATGRRSPGRSTTTSRTYVDRRGGRGGRAACRRSTSSTTSSRRTAPGTTTRASAGCSPPPRRASRRTRTATGATPTTASRG